ncbi:MAG: PHP domain-containing protein, partial [Bacteroidales bacterium]|nr:PHP domain-containing protein [Bacteroidales bacterium]
MFLNTHSYYSLRYGTMSIKNLVTLAKQHNLKALTLTDINNSTGMIDFVKTCRENQIKPIGGMDIRNGNEHLYT